MHKFHPLLSFARMMRHTNDAGQQKI